MARYVDLSSKKWLDLIFEGHNKEYGAYELRSESSERHLKVAIITAILAFVIAGLVCGGKYYFDWREQKEKEEKELLLKAEQERMMKELEEQEEEQEEEEYIPPEEEQIPEEEVLQSVKVTELVITEDKNVKEEDQIKSQDELKETDTAFGQKDNDQGTQDREVTRTLKDEVVVKEEKPVEEKPKQEQVFTAVEQMPEFPGGQAALLKFISNNIQYPQAAADNNVQGKVYVKFVVTSTGKVDKVQIARSVDKALDQEALRVCRMLPNFTPGRQNGQPVNVWYTLPVTFKLNN